MFGMGWEVGVSRKLQVGYIYHTLKQKSSHCVFTEAHAETIIDSSLTSSVAL